MTVEESASLLINISRGGLCVGKLKASTESAAEGKGIAW